jgi:hypothetical protein
MATTSLPRPLHTRVAVVLAMYLVIQIALVAAAFLWVFLYSAVIDTGGDAAYYQAYAQRASPVVAVLLSGPLFYAMGRFMRRFAAAAVGLAFAVVAINVVVDIAAVSTLAADVGYHAAMSIIATAAKCAGAWLGARPRGPS